MLYAERPENKRIDRAERTADGLILYSEAGMFRISPKTDRILRVTFTKEPTFSAAERPGIVFSDTLSDWDFSGSDSAVALTTAALTLIVDRETASFRFLTSDGAELLRDSGKDPINMEKFTVYSLSDISTEKIKTADGEKDVITGSQKTAAGHSWHARLNLKFKDGENLYGLGQHEEGFTSLRGQTVYLHQANRKIAVPLLVSSLGYGILTDTYSPLIFSDTPYGSYIYSEAVPELDYYFIYGGDMHGTVAGYRLLTGRAAMLPRWAFGYIQSQERYETQEEIISVAEEYRRRGIGLDCIVLDWNSWENGKWGQKTFDRSRFPEPEKMTDELHKNGVKFMISVWANPEEGTDDRREFEAEGLILPGCGFYNALSERGRQLYWAQLERELFNCGVDAWWCDNSEPFTPEWNRREKPEPSEMYCEYFRDAKDHLPAEYTNAYALYHAKAIYEGQRAKSDKKRVCNLTRSGYTGQQRYGTILWSGDIAATWDTLRRQIAAGLNFSASGLPYWTTDIGGFFVKNSVPWYWRGDFDRCFDDPEYCELFTRWYQWAAFLPIFRGHGTDCRRELWNLKKQDDEFYDAVIKANRLRYRLMPYIYSLAGNCFLNGGSIIYPLAFDFPKDKKAAEIGDQYMFGPSLMVCPVAEPMHYKKSDEQKQRKVYLPDGCGWYDFYSGEKFTGGQEMTVPADIEKIPVFVREGSVIPMAEYALCTEQQSPDITLKIFPGADAEYTLYEDAFDGCGYENGEYVLTKIRWNDAEQRVEIARSTDWKMNEAEAERRYRIKGYEVCEGKGISEN